MLYLLKRPRGNDTPIVISLSVCISVSKYHCPLKRIGYLGEIADSQGRKLKVGLKIFCAIK